MNHFGAHRKCFLFLVLILLALAPVGFAAQSDGSLRIQVRDELGGAVVGASAIIVSQNEIHRTAITNQEGVCVFAGLAQGTYSVHVEALGFAVFDKPNVQVGDGRRVSLDVVLAVTIEEQKVTVSTDQKGLGVGSDSNAQALVLKGKTLDALPDDPEDFVAVLRALAGPAVGPNGGDIYVDGFTGGRVPPKQSVSEVRISQNPLSAEYDRPGFGRIDIITRPGFGKWRGSANFSFNDKRMNARNPFAPNRGSFQSRLFGFSLSGPLTAKKSSFFLDSLWRPTNDSDNVNAIVLDGALQPARFNQTILQPRVFATLSPRFDFAINSHHTLVVRYTYSHFSGRNIGVSGLSLPSRAFSTSFTQHTFQLTETAVLNPKMISETRFQYLYVRNERNGDNMVPGVQVLDAFTGGGAQVGLSFNRDRRWELQNYSTATWFANHVFRFGARLRGVTISDVSRSNFGGTFIFTSLDQYRQVLQHAPGAMPAQFTLSGGGSEAKVSQLDVGTFFQDEWRLRANLTVTLGLRYEMQTNINGRFNLGPRISFAWAPGAANNSRQSGPAPPKFVIRSGFGLFYDRFNESNTLATHRFNGINQLRFNISNQDMDANGHLILNTVLQNTVFNPNGTILQVPTVETLTGLAQPQAVNRVFPALQTPYTMIGVINVERQLRDHLTAFALVTVTRQRHNLVVRDVNAPLPGSVTTLSPSGMRPDPTFSNIFEWESSGYFNMTQFQAGMRTQLNPRLSLFANYSAAKTTSNTDCVFNVQSNCFPSNSYDISQDQGRAASVPHHYFTLGGTLQIPQIGLTLNPLLIARTGYFFNIITGRDTNGDRIFRERPAFATAATLPLNLLRTPFGDFDLNPGPSEQLIPRNYGEGPGFASFNLSVSRTFDFGDFENAKKTSDGEARSGHTQAKSGARTEKRYHLTFSLSFQNLLNRSNLGTPIGNLSSPLFGRSISALGGFDEGGGSTSSANRRISIGLRLGF